MAGATIPGDLADRLAFGKRLPGAVYVARAGLSADGEHRRLADATARRLGLDPERFPVLKWHRDRPSLSLLAYPTFLVEPHPALATAVTVDLRTGTATTTEYDVEGDPPILHRCEELLPADHHQAESLRRLTRIEERFGLYQDTSRIGFRLRWQAALAERGLVLDGFDLRLVPEAPMPAGVPVAEWRSERQKTALHRVTPSVPVRMLLDRGLLRPEDRFFDYGCGRGRDVAALRASGIDAEGWDPCHAPVRPKCPAEVVHCGYVLNVIEDPDERAAVVRDAWSLAGRVLCIAVRVRGEDEAATGEPWGDGEMTRLGTFQRYFRPDELPGWLDGLLGMPVLPLAPGIAVVARDAATLHEVLARRSRAAFRMVVAPLDVVADGDATAVPPESRARRLGPRQQAIAAMLDQLDPAFRDLGRLPYRSEIGLPPEADSLGLSVQALWNRWLARIGDAAAAQVAERRRADVVVFLAMAHFGRVPRLTELPERLRRDVDVLCGGMLAALAAARDCLAKMGDPAVIADLCAKAGHGVLDAQALYVHRSVLPLLHPVLRCYVGCAEVLGAPVAEADLIKIHKASRKVTVLTYQGFETNPLPA